MLLPLVGAVLLPQIGAPMIGVMQDPDGDVGALLVGVVDELE